MIEMPLRWNLLENQQGFVSSLADDVLYVGGFGSGKTVAGAVRTTLLANHVPRNRILVARKTYRELYDTTYRTFMEGLPKDLYVGERRSDDIVYVRSRDGNPSEVFFRSLDRPEKFKSMELGAAWIDEASEATEEDFNVLKGRLRLPHAPYRCMYLTTNPTDKAHWLYRLFFLEARQGREVFRSTTYDNRQNLPKGYIEELERTYPREWIDIYLKGEFGFTLTGLPVFPNFSREIHVAKSALVWDRELPLLRGWDFGVVRPACTVYQRDREGRWLGLKEVMGFNVGTRRFAYQVKDICASGFSGATWLDYCDPAGFSRSQVDERTCVEELRQQEIYAMRLQPTSARQRAAVIDSCMTMLIGGRPALLLDPSMEITIQAFSGGYCRPKVAPGKPVVDDPIKDGYFEHLVDAAGFVFFGAHGAAGQRSPRLHEIRTRAKQRAGAYR